MWADSRPPARRAKWPVTNSGSIGLPRSYLRTPDGCIVWYEHRTCGAKPRQSSRAVLDVDNTIGRGPETTTITNALASLGGKGYCFYVKQYRHPPPSRLLRVAPTGSPCPLSRASALLGRTLLPAPSVGDVRLLSRARAGTQRRACCVRAARPCTCSRHPDRSSSTRLALPASCLASTEGGGRCGPR